MSVAEIDEPGLFDRVVMHLRVVDKQLLFLFDLRIGNGYSRHKRLGIRMQRMIEEFFRFCNFHDAALIDNNYPVANEANDGKVMSDEQVSQTLFHLEFLQEVQNLCADGNIESRDWLVGNDEFGFHYNGTGETDSLTLSAGKLVGIPCQVLREQADILCDLFDLGHSVLLILVEMEVIKAFGDYVFNGGTLIQ